MDNYLRLTGLVCEKDMNLVITKCNKACLHYANAKGYDQVIGKTDYELVWADNADIYRKHDLDALSGNHYSTIISQKFSRRKQDPGLLFLHTKLKKVNSAGKIIGISVRAVEIVNQEPASLINLLTARLPSEKNIFYFGKKNNEIKLSKRQHEILFYLSMRKSSKAIAKILDLSVRTIDYYIEIIKNKYQCQTRWELVDLAMEKGHIQTIPTDYPAKVLMRKMNTE